VCQGYPGPTDPEVKCLREPAGRLALGDLHRVLNEQQDTHDLRRKQHQSVGLPAQQHEGERGGEHGTCGPQTS
jgi:hypothetical protein